MDKGGQEQKEGRTSETVIVGRRTQRRTKTKGPKRQNGRIQKEKGDWKLGNLYESFKMVQIQPPILAHQMVSESVALRPKTLETSHLE